MLRIRIRYPQAKRTGILCAGVSLIELLISMTLAIVLLMSLVILDYGSAKTAAREENISSASRDSRLITRRLSRDLRLAGLFATEDMDGDSNDICDTCEVHGQPWSDGIRSDFEYASSYEIVFVGDVDNDDHTETTWLHLEGDALMQEQWKWSTVSRSWTGPVRRSLGTRVDRIIFDYFDRNQVAIGDTGVYPIVLSDGECREITGVQIMLVTRSEQEENRIPETVTLPDGVEITDRFRHSIVQFMVRGRNLGLGS